MEVVDPHERLGSQVAQTIRVTFASPRVEPAHFSGVGCSKKAALRAAKEAFADTYSARIEALLGAPGLPVVHMSDLAAAFGVCVVEDVDDFFSRVGPNDVVVVDSACIDGLHWVSVFAPRTWSLMVSQLNELTENVVAVFIHIGHFVKVVWTMEVLETLLPRDSVACGSVVDAHKLYAHSVGRERVGIARAVNDMEGLRNVVKVDERRTVDDLKARVVFAWYLTFNASSNEGLSPHSEDLGPFPHARWRLEGDCPHLDDERLDHVFKNRRASVRSTEPPDDQRSNCEPLLDTACIVAWLVVVRTAIHVCAVAMHVDHSDLAMFATVLVGTSVGSFSCVVAVAAQTLILAAACVDARCILTTTLYSNQWCPIAFSNLASVYLDMWLAPFTFSILSEFRYRIGACDPADLHRLRVKVASLCAAAVAVVALLQ